MLSPGDRVDRYEIVRALAEGGMAVVYLVRHTELDTLHALKMLTLAGDVLQDRLRSEGRVQARLRHPNVVRVSDVVQVGKNPALVMDYVDGPDLHAWIRTVHPDPELAEQVFRGIVDGVEAAHASGLVHRDLKPANVLMSRDTDGGWVPKVGDFGIVKLLSEEPVGPARTLSNVPLGTPEYMSPEQIRNPSKVDHRADLFSLGCILYELLAGHPAYVGTDMLTVFQAIEEGDRSPLPPGVPARLIRVIDACLRHDPEDRPADCAAIRAMLDGPPPSAPRAASPGALRGGLVLVGVAATAFVAVVSLAAVTTAVWWTWPDPGGLEPGPGTEIAPMLPSGDDPDPTLPPDDGPAPSRPRPSPPETEPETPIVPEPTPVPETRPEPERVDGPCPGIRGQVVGWFEAKPVKVLGVEPPTLGRTYDVSVQRTVYSDYPRSANGGQPGTPVCKLSPGTRIRVERAPIRDGRSYWVPFVVGSIVPE